MATFMPTNYGTKRAPYLWGSLIGGGRQLYPHQIIGQILQVTGSDQENFPVRSGIFKAKSILIRPYFRQIWTVGSVLKI